MLLRLERQITSMSANNDIVRNGQALPASLSYLLCCEKWIKDTSLDSHWDTISSIANFYPDPSIIMVRANRNRPFVMGACTDNIANGMGSIDNEIEYDLIEFARQTRDER